MKHCHAKWTSLAERLTIQEAAGLVVKETGKSLEYTISFLMDCAEQGYFTADIVAPSDSANVSHISRIDLSKSTFSTAELIEWLCDEMERREKEREEEHKRTREALAGNESRKWGYPVNPDDLHLRFIPCTEQLKDISTDDTVRMTTLNWVEYLTQELAERQGWTGAEHEAKCSVARAEYLNLFVPLASTLPLVQELTGAPWRGAKLPPDWLTNLHLVKPELRGWAKIHAPEIAESRLLAEPSASTPHTPATGLDPVAPDSLPTPIPEAVPTVSELCQVVGPRPQRQQAYQESEILRVIRELGYDPKKLPKSPPGRAGVKDEVRTQLKFSPKVFDKAWERLRVPARDGITDA
jgi:hypothetical protein